jgi:membrane protease subunit HflK
MYQKRIEDEMRLRKEIGKTHSTSELRWKAVTIHVKRFNKLFGGKPGGSSKKPKGPPMYLLIVMGFFIWMLSGLYQIDDSERGVVLRFGEYSETTMPGLSWRAPWPFESVEVVNVNVVNRFKQQTTMLTSDENIIVVDLVVQYRKSNPVDYLFNVRDAISVLPSVKTKSSLLFPATSRIALSLTSLRVASASLTLNK